MAMIFCPECGKQVSDRAAVCPNCAFPIESLKTDGEVQIKLTALQRGAMGGKQKAYIQANGETIWEGFVGQIAEIYFDKPTEITIVYKLSAMYYGAKCTGIIDPQKGKKYNVHSRQGMFKTITELQRVDFLDAD